MITATGVSVASYICFDIEERAFDVVKQAYQNMVPVKIGVGKGFENRITENRRLRLANGKEWTIRLANPMPPAQELVEIGPVDSEIGILRIDKKRRSACCFI